MKVYQDLGRGHTSGVDELISLSNLVEQLSEIKLQSKECGLIN